MIEDDIRILLLVLEKATGASPELVMSRARTSEVSRYRAMIVERLRNKGYKDGEIAEALRRDERSIRRMCFREDGDKIYKELSRWV